VFLRARWFEVCSHLIPVRGASEKPAAPSSKSATTHIVGAIMASERDVRLSQQILHQSVNVTTDEFVAWWWEHMNDQGETAEATSGSDSADESAYDEAAAGGEHDDDEAGASAQAVQDEAYAASSVMDAMLGAEDKQGGGKEKRMADEEPGSFTSQRIRELERVMGGCTKATPSGIKRDDQPWRRPFRLWTEPPLATFETWLEIRALANLRTREEERQSVMNIRAKAPAVIEKMRSFRMFGHDTKGVRASSLRQHLSLSKRDRRKHTLDRVELTGGAWSSVAVLPTCAVDFLMKLEDRRWKAGGARACSDLLLDAVEDCSPGLAAFVLHTEALVWSMPGAAASSAEDGRKWTRQLVEHVKSLDHLKECARRGRQVLDELDEIESAWPMVHARHSRAWAPMHAELWRKTQDHPSLCNSSGLEAYRALSVDADERLEYDGHACEFAISALASRLRKAATAAVLQELPFAAPPESLCARLASPASPCASCSWAWFWRSIAQRRDLHFFFWRSIAQRRDLHVCMHACMYVYMCVCVCLCVCVCVCVCVYVYMHLHT